MTEKEMIELTEYFNLNLAKEKAYEKYNIKLQKLKAKFFALIAEKNELLIALKAELSKIESDFQKDLAKQRKRKYL